MAEFFTVITNAGREAVAQAMQAGEKVDITHFAVGDGGGVPVQPSESQTQLVNECWRGLVSTYKQDGTNIIIDTYIPSDKESFTAREMGIFTADGTLFAVCNTPEMRKVLPSEGAVGDFAFGMKIDVSNLDTSYIEIHTNPMLDFVKTSEKGQPNGVATLDEFGNVEQLPELDFYTKAETLAEDTKTLFGLDVSALPDDVFVKLNSEIKNITNSINNRLRAVTGSYVGSGGTSKTIQVDGTPQVLFINYRRTWDNQCSTIGIFIKGAPVGGLAININSVGAVSDNEVVLASSFTNNSIIITGHNVINMGSDYQYTYLILCTY